MHYQTSIACGRSVDSWFCQWRNWRLTVGNIAKLNNVFEHSFFALRLSMNIWFKFCSGDQNGPLATVAGWTRDHSPIRGTVTGLGPRKLYQCALRSHMYSKRVQCRLQTRQQLVQPVPICAHCRDSESGESISISHSRSCGKLRQHALLELEPPSGRLFPTLCGGEWSCHPYREPTVLSYLLPLSRHASTQTPTDPKASLPSQCHPTTTPPRTT